MSAAQHLTTFHPGPLKLLVKTRNEIYQGQFEGKDAIFKYTNDQTREPTILRKVGKPELYRVEDDVISPSGKEFELLIILEFIPGLTLHTKSSLAQFNLATKACCYTKNIDIDELPQHVKKSLLIQIMKCLKRLEILGIEYRDDTASNTIISEDWLEGKIGTVDIIDYGHSTLEGEGEYIDTVTKACLLRLVSGALEAEQGALAYAESGYTDPVRARRSVQK